VTRLSALSLLLLSFPALAAEPCDAERTAAMRAEQDEPAYTAALGTWGICAEKAGHFADAHRLVSRALEGAPAETTLAGKATRWTTLRAALRRLDERVARVLVTWDAGELYVDERPVEAISGAVLPLDPGTHRLTARKGGKVLAAQTIVARAGDLPAVNLKAPEPKPAPVNISRTSQLPRNQSTFQPVSPLVPSLTPRGIAVGTAYASGAVAVVSAVVAGILEAQRVSLRSGLTSDACPTPDASARCAELRQVFEQSRAARNVALVAAAVAVAAGGVAIGLHFAGGRAKTAGMVTVGGSW
jgi:hypothetical protein